MSGAGMSRDPAETTEPVHGRRIAVVGLGYVGLPVAAAFGDRTGSPRLPTRDCCLEARTCGGNDGPGLDGPRMVGSDLS